MNETQWKNILTYVLDRLKDEGTFEVSDVIFVKKFELEDGYYADLIKRNEQGNPIHFRVRAPYKDKREDPAGHITFSRVL